WVCRSMKPGASTRPPPSITRNPRAPPAATRPMRSIRSPRTSTSVRRPGWPLPSTSNTARSTTPATASPATAPTSRPGAKPHALPAAIAARNSRLDQPSFPMTNPTGYGRRRLHDDPHPALWHSSHPDQSPWNAPFPPTEQPMLPTLVLAAALSTVAPADLHVDRLQPGTATYLVYFHGAPGTGISKAMLATSTLSREQVDGKDAWVIEQHWEN